MNLSIGRIQLHIIASRGVTSSTECVIKRRNAIRFMTHSVAVRCALVKTYPKCFATPSGMTASGLSPSSVPCYNYNKEKDFILSQQRVPIAPLTMFVKYAPYYQRRLRIIVYFHKYSEKELAGLFL